MLISSITKKDCLKRRVFRSLLKGNKIQRFADIGLIELIQSNNFHQQSYVYVSSLPETIRTRSPRQSMDDAVLETERSSEVDLVDTNCAYCLSLSHQP